MSLQNVNSYTYTPGFTQGQFHNAVLCISGNVQSLYLNGVLVGSTTTASNILSYYPTINQILLGCAGDKSNGFTGYLDDFRVYKYAFNQSQVSSLYSNRNLIAYYPFDTSFNNVANNIITTGNHATVSYDATLVGNATISTTTNNYLVGTGALNLTNTAGTVSTAYVNSTCGFSTSATNQLSVSLWFKTTGIAGRKMRLFDLSPVLGTQGIYVDISGTNMINTRSNAYTLPQISTSAGPVVSRGLIAYFSLNNTTLESVSNRITNTSNTITYTTSSNKTGIVCNGGNYNASSTNTIQNVNIPSFSITVSNGVSISFWFYANNLSQSPIAFSLAGTLNWDGAGYMISFNNTSIYFTYANYNGGGYAGYATTGGISTNTWYHITCTLNGTTGSIFINGVNSNAANTTNQGGSNSSLNITSSHVMSIGTTNTSSAAAGYTGSTFPNLNGIISNVAIYNTVLTSIEINSLYNANK